MNGLVIRLERPEDHRAVEMVTREAFWNQYVPGCDEHYLAHLLRGSTDFLPALDFVAERDGAIVGNIMYSRAWVHAADGLRHEVTLFGPLSVLPACQNSGVGSALVRHSTQAACAMGHRAILIYGDPAYYRRFGFVPASTYSITPPDGKPHPALQALVLQADGLRGISGTVHDAPEFHQLDATAVEAFDLAFPCKEKQVTESQRRFARMQAGYME